MSNQEWMEKQLERWLDAEGQLRSRIKELEAEVRLLTELLKDEQAAKGGHICVAGPILEDRCMICKRKLGR